MIALGIVTLIIGLITFIGAGLAFTDEKFILAIWLFVAATFFCSMGLCWIVNEFKSQEQKIECSEIKQIDTLYKNDSIIGYEIIYME